MYLAVQANQLRHKLIAGMTLPREFELPRIWVRLLTFIAPLLLLGAVLLQPWAEPKWMFLDPLTAAQLSGECCSTYFGFVSNLGIMIWSSTAAVCLFSAALFALLKADRALTWFALSSGILTGWLALDDTFLVHETVMPSLGVPQNAVIAAYAALALLYIASSWRVILASDFWILLIGGLALVVSIVVDTAFHSLNPSLVYIEDSAKFFGIFCWASFHITSLFERISYLAVQK